MKKKLGKGKKRIGSGGELPDRPNALWIRNCRHVLGGQSADAAALNGGRTYVMAAILKV